MIICQKIEQDGFGTEAILKYTTAYSFIQGERTEDITDPHAGLCRRRIPARIFTRNSRQKKNQPFAFIPTESGGRL